MFKSLVALVGWVILGLISEVPVFADGNFGSLNIYIDTKMNLGEQATLKTSSNLLVVAVTGWPDNTRPVVHLVAFDGLGRTIWTSLLPDQNEPFAIIKLIELADKSILAVAKHKNGGSLLKLSSEGVLKGRTGLQFARDEYFYNYGDVTFLSASSALPDQIVIIAERPGLFGAFQRGLIFFDLDGRVLRRTLTVDSRSFAQAAALADGSYLITGRQNNRPWIARFGRRDELIWQHIDISTGGADYADSLVVSERGILVHIYAVVGRFQGFEFLDLNGRKLWETSLNSSAYRYDVTSGIKSIGTDWMACGTRGREILGAGPYSSSTYALEKIAFKISGGGFGTSGTISERIIDAPTYNINTYVTKLEIFESAFVCVGRQGRDYPIGEPVLRIIGNYLF